jgi:hypothetical protein
VQRIFAGEGRVAAGTDAHDDGRDECDECDDRREHGARVRGE